MSNNMNYQPSYTPGPPTSTMAIVSLVSGILGWTLIPFFGSIVAVITGHMARKEIKNSYGNLSGNGLAIAGLILGYLALAGYCLAIVIGLLFFGGIFGLSTCAILSDSGSFAPPPAW